MRLTKEQRGAIIARIDASTDYDADTIRIHRDGSISAILDADKTRDGPHYDRLMIGHAEDYL